MKIFSMWWNENGLFRLVKWPDYEQQRKPSCCLKHCLSLLQIIDTQTNPKASPIIFFPEGVGGMDESEGHFWGCGETPVVGHYSEKLFLPMFEDIFVRFVRYYWGWFSTFWICVYSQLSHTLVNLLNDTILFVLGDKINRGIRLKIFGIHISRIWR